MRKKAPPLCQCRNLARICINELIGARQYQILCIWSFTNGMLVIIIRFYGFRSFSVM